MSVFDILFTSMNEKQNTFAPDRVTPDIETAIARIKNSRTVSVYDTDGKKIFLGTPQQFLIARNKNDFGVDLDTRVGDISDAEGKSIIRFGSSDGNGFVNRSRVREIFDVLRDSTMSAEQVREALRINETESHEQLYKTIRDIFNEIHFKDRINFYDNLFLYSHGVRPDGMAYDTVSPEIGQYFDAHGIARTDQLEMLLTLLEKGIDNSRTFYTAPFEVPNEVRAGLGSVLGTSGGTALKDGIAIVVSGFKKQLALDGIQIVFINDYVGRLIEPLKKLFPQYQFYLLSEQKRVLEAEAGVEQS